MAKRIIPPYIQSNDNSLLITSYDFDMYNELLNIVLDLTIRYTVHKIEQNSNLVNWIYQKTPVLINTQSFSYSLITRCRWILSGRSNFPICAFCGEQFGQSRNQVLRYDYSLWCSNRCRQSDPITISKCKATKLKNHGDENYCNTQKITQTFMKHYGVSNPNKLESIKNKICNTNLDRYGYRYASQSPEVKEKNKQTCLERYGYEYALQVPKIKEKSKQTCLQKYDVEYALQAIEIREKIKHTCLEQYGVDNTLKSPIVQAKIKQTNIIRYGFDIASKSNAVKEKNKQTCLERYGYEYALQVPKIKEKSKQTCLQKYGVEYISQSVEIRKKSQRKYKYDGLHFDSKPEIAYYIWLKDHNIDFTFQPNCEIPYIIDGVCHWYFPDFLVNNNILVEIKGDHFFKNDKMICPFTKKLSYEQRIFMDRLNNAKYQCMIANNVIIFKSKQFNHFMKYVDLKYGKKFLSLLKQ